MGNWPGQLAWSTGRQRRSVVASSLSMATSAALMACGCLFGIYIDVSTRKLCLSPNV